LFLQSYMHELKQHLLPVPVACEGFRCNHCDSPVLRTDSPMDFYDDDHVCDEILDEDYDCYEDYSETNEDELNEFIDYVLDTNGY
jgi:hypothetical protein